MFLFWTDAHEEEASSGSEAWEERETSRTHSVKFSEDSGIADKDTPFVRQNTPHPKELKLKAHKLFSKDKTKTDEGNLDTLSEEVSVQYTKSLSPFPTYAQLLNELHFFRCGTRLVVIETIVGENYNHQFYNNG